MDSVGYEYKADEDERSEDESTGLCSSLLIKCFELFILEVRIPCIIL